MRWPVLSLVGKITLSTLTVFVSITICYERLRFTTRFGNIFGNIRIPKTIDNASPLAVLLKSTKLPAENSK
jgi:hypothetical protein